MNTVKLRKAGNSVAATIPSDVLTQANLKVGDDVSITAKDGSVTMIKTDSLDAKLWAIHEKCKRRYDYTLRELGK